ncbi:hypothetical protein BpHYR1_021219 [Brachionus plicatilis]|uniref:Uncharacterized protein n=1 Tax=Brachionus plicatilis TaxID=10195 RepID=A0A3M7T2M5_BRAPC|nr:hypothetical protein BpHYR1_021219 [Brachionus plicatilis]
MISVVFKGYHLKNKLQKINGSCTLPGQLSMDNHICLIGGQIFYFIVHSREHEFTAMALNNISFFFFMFELVLFQFFQTRRIQCLKIMTIISSLIETGILGSSEMGIQQQALQPWIIGKNAPLYSLMAT